MPSTGNFWKRPLAPLRWAAAWVVYVGMRAVTHLPFRWQLALGKAFGGFSYLVARRRRHVVETNLRLCFPDLTDDERQELAREHFRSLGASFAEMAMGWYGSIDEIASRVTIEGLEHLERALDKGCGVILYSGHFTSFEIFFPVLAAHCPRLCGMYKVQTNPLMNRVMTRGRSRNFDRLFVKDNVRDMLSELKRNAVVWYAADQSHAVKKGSALIPFFGEPAMTNTGASRIARISGATVLPYLPRRLADDTGYTMTIGPPLEDFPTDDEVADTRRLVKALEEHVRTCPEQYWWVHQRFKARPEPYPDVYRSANEPV